MTVSYLIEEYPAIVIRQTKTPIRVSIFSLTPSLYLLLYSFSENGK